MNIDDEAKDDKQNVDSENFKAFFRSELFSVKLEERVENVKQRHLSFDKKSTESAGTSSISMETISLEKRVNLSDFSDDNRPEIGKVAYGDNFYGKRDPQVSFSNENLRQNNAIVKGGGAW